MILPKSYGFDVAVVLATRLSEERDDGLPTFPEILSWAILLWVMPLTINCH